MLSEVSNFIKDSLLEVKNEIELIDITEQSADKVEIVLSRDNFMASIVIYSNNIYDFLAVEINSEKIMLNTTNSCENSEDLKSKIKYEIYKFSEL